MRIWLLPVGVLCALLALALFRPLALAQPVAGRTAAATENQLATREALTQMGHGGNAVDAAVAAALVAGVTSPTSSGIGGGGFALVWLSGVKQPYLLDFRETAPRGVDAAAFERRPLAAEERGKLIGVPGEVRGLHELHRKHGKRRWADVVAPAVRYARTGFAAGKHLSAQLARSTELPKLDSGLASVFFGRGQPAVVGQLIRNPKLAKTLARIAAEGPSAFYTGPIAADIVASANKVGGALTLEELEAYAPRERRPLHVQWEGHDVYTMPPPSAGGMMVAQTLRLFSKAELQKLGFGSGAYQHMVAEALRAATADRMRYIGDPELEKIDIEALISPKRMAVRRRSIALDRTHAIPRFGLEGQGTHHLVTADGAGNVVSLTTTVNRLFGAKVTGEESGVVLNDELDDFTEQEDVLPFGMKQSPNRPRPGARPTSSMTPTLVVREGQVVLALGGSGGPTIATNVTQLLLARLVFGHAPERAVSEPRFYIPSKNAFILLEQGAPDALVKDLEARGEIVATMPFKGSAVQMIAFEDGRPLPASDPRKFGEAGVR